MYDQTCIENDIPLYLSLQDMLITTLQMDLARKIIVKNKTKSMQLMPQ